jgi:uncharacterized protein YkwD
MARKIFVVCLLAVLGCLALAPATEALDLSRLIAPASVCPNQDQRDSPTALQEREMRCMTDFARQRAGLVGLVDSTQLDRSAEDKSRDILRCGEFSHTACGRSFTFWIQRVGYIPAQCWRVGENIAWGSGELGSVGAIFRAWIHSPEHLANILGRYTQIGIGVEVGRLEGHGDAHVWTQDFGSHCAPIATRPLARLADAIAVSP